MDPQRQFTARDLGYALQATSLVAREFFTQMQAGMADASAKYSEHRQVLAQVQAPAAPEPPGDIPEWEFREIAGGSF